MRFQTHLAGSALAVRPAASVMANGRALGLFAVVMLGVACGAPLPLKTNTVSAGGATLLPVPPVCHQPLYDRPSTAYPIRLTLLDKQKQKQIEEEFRSEVDLPFRDVYVSPFGTILGARLVDDASLSDKAKGLLYREGTTSAQVQAAWGEILGARHRSFGLAEAPRLDACAPGAPFELRSSFGSAGVQWWTSGMSGPASAVVTGLPFPDPGGLPKTKSDEELSVGFGTRRGTLIVERYAHGVACDCAPPDGCKSCDRARDAEAKLEREKDAILPVGRTKKAVTLTAANVGWGRSLFAFVRGNAVEIRFVATPGLHASEADLPPLTIRNEVRADVALEEPPKDFGLRDAVTGESLAGRCKRNRATPLLPSLTLAACDE